MYVRCSFARPNTISELNQTFMLPFVCLAVLERPQVMGAGVWGPTPEATRPLNSAYVLSTCLALVAWGSTGSESGCAGAATGGHATGWTSSLTNGSKICPLQYGCAVVCSTFPRTHAVGLPT